MKSGLPENGRKSGGVGPTNTETGLSKESIPNSNEPKPWIGYVLIYLAIGLITCATAAVAAEYLGYINLIQK
ncbi:hypothetical protein A2379_04995 [Candidatus Amesbacteria bacterium RIFOXYB1_FULL_47_13]|nr:MAG: hypothetical protein A2379_04995 [Candidatus Amesbacteria bacterium RIFOXYB1_FULL_47_13]HBC72464.1 hypothetical protein [Candidatus Amesbacteria bacterium]